MKLNEYIGKISKACSLWAVLLMSIIVVSCNDDLDISYGFNELNEDYIYLDFIVPEAEYVSTRANYSEDEGKINELTLLIFNRDTKKIVQRMAIPADKLPGDVTNTNEFKLTVQKNDASKRADNLVVYALANANSEITGFTENSDKTIEELEDKDTQAYSLAQGFFMTGRAEIGGRTTIALIRSAGKVTMRSDVEETKFKLLNFDIYQPMKDGYLTAGVTNKFGDNYIETVPELKDDNTVKKTDDKILRYSMPTKTHSENAASKEDIKTYIIIKGEFNGTETYYAVPLYSQKLKQHFDIEPNHWYDIVIEEINNAGMSSPAEAIAHPCDYIIYEIHDHAPEVLSMVSDGIRELGVKGVVELQMEGGEITGYLTVKCYSAYTSEMETFKPQDIRITVPEEILWFSLDPVYLKEITYEDDDTEADRGKQYQFKLNAIPRYSEQTEKIKVEWMGLSREVTVRYNPGFVINNACNVSLTIRDENGDVKNTISNYWQFIQGNDSNNKLYGNDENAMADGKVRDRGFHFPMPYGQNSPSKSWSYVYDVDFTPLDKEMEGYTLTGISISTGGSSFLQNVKWTPKGTTGSDILKGTLTLEESAHSKYDYASGKITFRIESTKEGKQYTRNITVDLYHTGFFHLDQSDYVEDKGYYYYEVIPMEGTHWLDRNIGAKSNKMYVDVSNTSTPNGVGEPDAIGSYVKVANYTNAQYSDPNIVQEMCPLGYHIPVSSEWNSVRLSSKFVAETINDNNQSYSATYYTSSVGNVYFPRAKYFNQAGGDSNNKSQTTANMGDASTGYYWTSTAAPGMEKLEMGKWLRGLYINGANSTYMNMNVVDSKLNLRCVAGSSIPKQDNYYVSFNVHNVTHIYLFDPESGTPLYTFPGKAVGSAASSEKWQYFSCTTSVDPGTLGVLFVKMDSDGKITLFTKSGTSFEKTSTKFNDKINSIRTPANKGYWEIQPGYYYDFCDTDKGGALNVTKDQPDEEHCSAMEGTTGGSGTVSDLNVEYPEEELVIWSGEKSFYGWSDNLQDLKSGSDNVNWQKVGVGTTIKFYIEPLGGQVTLQTLNGNWNSFGDHKNYRQSIKNDGLQIIEFVLDASMISNLRNNNGLILQGENFKLYGVTLILKEDSGEGGNPPTEFVPDSDTEKVLWKGEVILYNWSNKFENFVNTSWLNDVKVGTQIKVYTEAVSSGYNLQLFYGDWYSRIDEYTNSGNPKYTLTVTQEILSNMLNHNGFLMQGNNCKLIGVTLVN